MLVIASIKEAYLEGFLKRLAAIVIVTALILTMSAGTAFAAACSSGMPCEKQTKMPCCSERTYTCADMAGQGTVLHSTCEHETDRDVKDAVTAQPIPPVAVAGESLPVAAPLHRLGFTHGLLACDARGAPHLTSVIRI